MDFEGAPVGLVEEVFVDCLQQVEEVGGMVGGGWGRHGCGDDTGVVRRLNRLTQPQFENQPCSADRG